MYEKPAVLNTLTEQEVFGGEDLMTSAWSNSWSNHWTNGGGIDPFQRTFIG